MPLQSHRDAVALFRPSRSRTRPHRKTPPTRSWTGNFFCFSDKNTYKIPASTEKSILQKAGLGSKKIQFLITDNAETVTTKIKSEFPKLMEGGGFEILRCLPNCRNLSVIDCNWDANSLRSTIGGQAKIYIRPIQSNLPIDDLEIEPREEIKETCRFCSQKFNVRELRQHIDNCSQSSQITIQSSIGDTATLSVSEYATGNDLSTVLYVEDNPMADLPVFGYSLRLPDLEPGDVSTPQFGETSEATSEATSHSEVCNENHI